MHNVSGSGGIHPTAARYRNAHPEYCERNRRQQLTRTRSKVGAVLVNLRAPHFSGVLPAGMYRIVRLRARVAKMDTVRPTRGWTEAFEGFYRSAQEQMAKMEREMATVQGKYKAVEQSYGQDVLNLVVARAYLVRLLGNSAVVRYLKQRQPDFLAEFEAIVKTGSLD